MSSKTNAVRLVQQAGFPCEEKFYEFDENDLNGNHAANAIGYLPEQVFKTLVVRGPKTGINVFCVPVCCELDLKKAARACGRKSIAMIPSKQLLPLTGYIHGGCSPVGMKKRFPTFIDETAILFDTICVSGGKVGLNLEINPEVLASTVDAQFVDLAIA